MSRSPHKLWGHLMKTVVPQLVGGLFSPAPFVLGYRFQFLRDGTEIIRAPVAAVFSLAQQLPNPSLKAALNAKGR